ncbi:MAG: SPOR domain-containing protein [Gammaproteobacteria bacterium]
MRNLFLLLLLVNLGFLAWRFWVAPEPERMGAEPEVAPTLQTPDPMAGGTAPANQPGCVSLGPFLNAEEAERAATRLRNGGYTPEQRVVEAIIATRTWVYLPPFPTRERARDAMRDLRDQGVTDLYVEPGPENRNAISLGLFSSPTSAERRAREIRALGYETRVSRLPRRSFLYWLDFELQSYGLVEAREFQTAPERILRLEPRPCP